MITHKLLANEGILILRPQESLKKEDFAQLSAELDPYLRSRGPLRGILIQAEAFPGWQDFSALISHLKFIREYHRHILKVAVVSDNKVLTIFPALARHFVAADLRHFHKDDAGMALGWIRSRGAEAVQG